MKRHLTLIFSTWMVVVFLSIIHFLVELSLSGRSVPLGTIAIGQAIKWAIWLLLSLPAVFFSYQIWFHSLTRIVYQIFLAFTVIFTYTIVLNALLFLLEDVPFEQALFFHNLKVLIADELMTLFVFYAALILAANLLFEKTQSLFKSPAITYPEHLSIKTGGITELVDVNRISYIEAYGYCVKVFSQEKTHVLRKSLNALEEELDPAQFVRIHRSTLVNRKFLKQVARRNGQMKVILKSGKELHVSKRKMSKVRKYLS